MASKHSTPESYWVKIGNSEISRNRKHLRLLEPDWILIASEEDKTLSEAIAVEFGTDSTESETGVDVDPGSSSTDGEDLCSLDHIDQIAEAVLENSSDIVVTKSGRPNRSDYMYY